MVTDNLPPLRWWDREDMMLSEFYAQLKVFRQREYRRGDVQYTHDAYIGDTWIGEAGRVEELGPYDRIGFLDVGKLGPVYSSIQECVRLVPKAESS